MLTHPNKRVLQALATLENDTDFQEIVKWLQESKEQIATDSFYVKDEYQARWHQGAGQVVMEFIEKAKTARDSVRKF